MSENVERLRAFMEPWDGAPWDAESLAAWQARAELLAPDVIYEDATMFDETFRGRDGVARAFQQWVAAFADTHLTLVRIAGKGDVAVSIHDFRATAHVTGIEFKGRFAYIWEFRDGVVVRYRSVSDAEGALREAGLAD